MKKLSLFLFLVLLSGYIYSQALSAELKIPETVVPNTDFVVEVTVTKSNINGFMKFSQRIPKNYEATKIDTKGGAFTSTDTLVKIIWLSPPVENVFTFSYKLKVKTNTIGNEKFIAKIDYLVNQQHKSFEFENKTFEISNNLLHDPSQAATSSVSVTISQPEVKSTPPSSIVNAEPPVVQVAVPTTKTEMTQTKLQSPVINNNKSVVSEKITYSVQVGAYSKKVPIAGVKELRSIKTNSGIIKYLSGEFKSHEDAERRQKELKSSGFKDAFIVKFINGKIAE